MIIAVVILFPVLYIAEMSSAGFFELFLLTVGFVTWLVWHGLSPKLASLMFHGRGTQSKLDKDGYSVFIARDSAPDEFKAMRVVRQSFYPLIFLFGTTTLIIPILGYFGLWNFLGFSGSNSNFIIEVILLSILVWPTTSVFIVPIKWTVDKLGVRHFDHEKNIVRALELSPYLADFISFSVVYQFLLTVFTTGRPYVGVIYLIASLLMLFPPTLLMTALYMRFSLAKHVQALQASFQEKGYELSRKNLRLVEPARQN
jgi:hypothetical protein